MSHQCVVAPGLGAFLVHESEAFYDEAGSRFMPPARLLGFNPDVNLNDGLLVQSVARREHLSIENARQKVDAAIASFRRQLEEGSVLPVGNLGEMSMVDGRLIFEPSDSSAVAFRYRGLTPLDITPLAASADSEADDTAAEILKAPTVFNRALKVAASLIIVLLACGIFLTTGNLLGDRQSADRASLDSSLRQNISAVRPAPDTMECDPPISREITLTIAMPAPEADATSSSATSSGAPVPDRYLLVVGSFQTLTASQRFVGSDTSLSILEMDGRFRIYAASAPTFAEATRLADIVREAHPSVWICKR